MSKLSLSVYLNAYNDRHPSNNPSRSDFKWARDLNSMVVANAQSQSAQIAPGETLQLFMGMRMLAQDITTQYSISLLPETTSTYVLSAVGGTLPNFRTPRVTGADATTQVSTSINGPLETFTSSPGTFAQFVGQIPGMPSPVTITANVLGVGGNSVLLVGDGTSSINTLITNWNIANPLNQITLTTGVGTQVPNAPQFAVYSGVILGTSGTTVITANNAGTVGNSVLLTGDGVSTTNVLIANWNTANPSNQITLFAGDGTQVPSGGEKAFYTGDGNPATPGFTPVTITSDNFAEMGNDIELIGDGISSIDTLIANWNIANPTNTASLTAGLGGQVPEFGSLFNLANGSDPAIIQLAGGVNANIALAGGTTATLLNLIVGGVVVGDYVSIGDEFAPANQGVFQVLAVTATSFTVSNPAGIAQGAVTLGADFANQIQIFGAAGVQINDILMITGGFSSVTQGSYKVTAVFANSLQFTSTSVLPQEGPITTDDIAIYSSAKTLVYMESDSALSVDVNGTVIGTIEPFVIPNAHQPSFPPQIIPGVFMLKSIIYSLSVTNNGLVPANMFYASVE